MSICHQCVALRARVESSQDSRWQSRSVNEFIEQKPLANCARISYYSLSCMKGIVALLVGMSVSAVVAIAFGFIAGHLTALIAAASLLCGAAGAIHSLTTLSFSAVPAEKRR